MSVKGAFWGRGKCPVCERPYQKDIRLIWLENNSGRIPEMIKLCSWCLICMLVEMLKISPDVKIEWQNKKEDERFIQEAIKELK